jgi:hypothetical protein
MSDPRLLNDSRRASGRKLSATSPSLDSNPALPQQGAVGAGSMINNCDALFAQVWMNTLAVQYRRAYYP